MLTGPSSVSDVRQTPGSPEWAADSTIRCVGSARPRCKGATVCAMAVGQDDSHVVLASGIGSCVWATRGLFRHVRLSADCDLSGRRRSYRRKGESHGGLDASGLT